MRGCRNQSVRRSGAAEHHAEKCDRGRGGIGAEGDGLGSDMGGMA